jgi:hypothetical protein
MTKQPEDTKKSVPGVPVFIDRIEEGLAVIVLSEEDEFQFDLPLKYLPPGVKEGDHLTLSFKLDPASAAARRQRLAELKKELTQDRDPKQKNFKL